MKSGDKLEYSLKKILKENPESLEEKLNTLALNLQKQENSLDINDIKFEILSVNDYSIFEWAIENGDIKMLEFLFSQLSDEQVQETLEYDDNALFQKFLSIQYTKILLNDFDQEECINGMKFFLAKYSNHPESVINDFDKTIDNYVKDHQGLEESFLITIQGLQENNIITQETFDIYSNAIDHSTELLG